MVRKQRMIQTFLNTNDTPNILRISLEFERINRQNGVFMTKIRFKYLNFVHFMGYHAHARGI